MSPTEPITFPEPTLDEAFAALWKKLLLASERPGRCTCGMEWCSDRGMS